MRKGWVKIHRELLSKAIWKASTPEQKTILVTLLLMASHTKNEWEWGGNRFAVQPGQFVTSLDQISRNTGKGITIQNIRTSLKRFEKFGFLTNKSTKSGRLITIMNWYVYQGVNDSANIETNKGVTRSQQRPHTYQEVKNVKKESEKAVGGKRKVKTAIPKNYTLSKDHIEYAKGKGLSSQEIEYEFESFTIYHRKQGSKFVSWFAAWQTWVRRHLDFKKNDYTEKPMYQDYDEMYSEDIG